MNKHLGYVFGLLFMLTASQAHAIPITFNFTQGGYTGGASVFGSFTGDDLDMNGQINSFAGETLAYTMTFTGNAIVGSFTHTFSDFGGLVYDIGTPFLGDGSTLAIEGVASGPTFGPPGPFTYESGLGPQGMLGGIVMDNTTGATDSSAQLVVVSQIPEPTTFALMGLGLAALGLRRKHIAREKEKRGVKS